MRAGMRIMYDNVAHNFRGVSNNASFYDSLA